MARKKVDCISLHVVSEASTQRNKILIYAKGEIHEHSDSNLMQVNFEPPIITVMIWNTAYSKGQLV